MPGALHLSQLDAGTDDAEEEPIGEHVSGIEPGILGQADYQDAAEGPDGGGQHPPDPGIQCRTEGLHACLKTPQQQGQIGEQGEDPRLSPHLQIVVVGVDGIGAVKVGRIGLENLLHHIGAKADTAFVNQEIRDLNAELENVKAGYATTAITDQLRADLTTVTNDLTTASNKLQEVDRISTDLGVAIKDLTTVKGDLEGLKDRIEDLEGADLNLSEYSEFTALANRVQTLEGKWGELSWEDIDANTSAIEQINLKLNAFFAEKADATAKDIYNKLVALETWKTDVVEQFMSGITNSEATGKLDQALADIEDLRTQLGLIAKDPEEGEEGEEPTANFYDKATIDEMFKKVEGEMAMLFDTPNSLV